MVDDIFDFDFVEAFVVVVVKTCSSDCFNNDVLVGVIFLTIFNLEDKEQNISYII